MSDIRHRFTLLARIGNLLGLRCDVCGRSVELRLDPPRMKVLRQGDFTVFHDYSSDGLELKVKTDGQ